MNYLYLILIAVVLIILFIIFKTVLKAFFKLFIFAILALLLASGVIGYLVYNDAIDFKEKFTISDNLVLLEDNGRILTGFVIKKAGESSALTSQMLDEYNGYYANNDYGKILGSNYKMIMIKTTAFRQDGSIEYDGQQLDRRLMLATLKSDNPVDTYLDGVSNKLGLLNVDRDALKQNAGVDDSTLKTSFFVILYTNDLGTNPVNIILQYKKGNIFVYPETIMFKFVKYLPSGLVESFGLFKDNIYKQNITGMLAWLGRL